MTQTTQAHIPISDISDRIVLLKDGSACIVLQTSAVNFGLLSEEEQLAIISSFAQMLNSLSFAIQITTYSKRLDISSYIKLLDQALNLQTNPLLSAMITRYKSFVQSLIKEREVLDKRFYITINVSSLELGIGLKSTEERLKKIKAIIIPRRDQITRQLARVGLKATQLEDKALIELFYEIYNPKDKSSEIELQRSELDQAAVKIAPQTPPQPSAETLMPPISNLPKPNIPTQPITAPRARTHPFVVEELVDTV